MDSPLVDVVLATNRASPFLTETVESLRRQSYRHWQLTIVDDGTPDARAVPHLTTAVQDAKVIRQPNAGVAAARNRGIREGRAPLVALLDDDDVWEPSKLEEQVAALAAAPHAVACFSAGRYIDGIGQDFGEGWPAQTVPSRLFVNGEVPAPRIVTLMVRRSAHEAIGGFNESYALAEDNEYILRLALTGSMVAVPRPLVRYRRHDANTSKADSIEGRRANRRLLLEHLAARADEEDVYRLLMAHRRRFESRAAAECVRGLAHAVRHRDPLRLAEELRWALSAPWMTVAALGRAVRTR